MKSNEKVYLTSFFFCLSFPFIRDSCSILVNFRSVRSFFHSTDLNSAVGQRRHYSLTNLVTSTAWKLAELKS